MEKQKCKKKKVCGHDIFAAGEMAYFMDRVWLATTIHGVGGSENWLHPLCSGEGIPHISLLNHSLMLTLTLSRGRVVGAQKVDERRNTEVKMRDRFERCCGRGNGVTR